MEAHPSIVEEAMAVEPTDANESAAAPQGAGSEVLLEDTDLESPSKKRKVCCKIICTLMCMFSIVPNMYRVSHSACVSERVFPTYYKTKGTSTTPAGAAHLRCISAMLFQMHASV